MKSLQNLKIESKRSDLRLLRILQFILIFGPFAMGLFHEWTSCIVSVILAASLVSFFIRQKQLSVPRCALFAALLILSLSYAGSVLWAIDKGMAPFGFSKFLVLPFFFLAIGQLAGDQRTCLWKTVPLSGGIMILLTVLFSFIPHFHDYLIVNHRLAGFFQYPNTFALYLLVAAIVILYEQNMSAKHYMFLGLLLAGILASGSRTVFVLTLFTVLFYLYKHAKDRKARTVGLLLAGLLILAVIYVLMSGEKTSIGRFLTISFSSRQLLGRLLYLQDALPVILRHPLGLGYLGYFFTQGSFQTGAYSIMHIHNDLCQIALDVGWIPAIVCLIGLIRAFREQESERNRLIMIVIVIHGLFDFSLQFMAIAFLLLLAAYPDHLSQKSIVLKNKYVVIVPSVAAIVVCLYFGTAAGLHYFKADDAASNVYPFYTLAWIDQLDAVEDPDEMDVVADRVLKVNPYASIAYSAKARAAFGSGKVREMTEYKLRAISLNKFDLNEYLDYLDMLRICTEFYRQEKDDASTAYCIERIREAIRLMQSAEESASELGIAAEPPDLELPTVYKQWIYAL